MFHPIIACRLFLSWVYDVNNFWFLNAIIFYNTNYKLVIASKLPGIYIDSFWKFDDSDLFPYWLIRLVISPLNWGVGLCCFRWHDPYIYHHLRCEKLTAWIFLMNTGSMHLSVYYLKRNITYFSLVKFFLLCLTYKSDPHFSLNFLLPKIRLIGEYIRYM